MDIEYDLESKTHLNYGVYFGTPLAQTNQYTYNFRNRMRIHMQHDDQDEFDSGIVSRVSSFSMLANISLPGSL